MNITLTDRTSTTPNILVRVDSASNFCVFGRQWAEYLELNWEAGQPVNIGTATGIFLAYQHEITIHLFDFKWTASGWRLLNEIRHHHHRLGMCSG